MYSPQP